MMMRAGLAALAALLALPGAAGAADYCVPKSAPPAACPAGATIADELGDALKAAQASAVADHVYLGAGTFTTESGFSHDAMGSASNDVFIHGAGRESTFLTADAATKSSSFVVLRLRGSAGSVVEDLEVVVPDPAGPGVHVEGIRLEGAAGRRLDIADAGNPAEGITGASLTAPSALSLSRVLMNSSANAVTTNGRDVRIEDVELAGGRGVSTFGKSLVSRARIATNGTAVTGSGGDVDIDNSLIRLGPDAVGLHASAYSIYDAAIRASHVTVIGPSASDGDNSVGAFASSGGSAPNASVVVDNSILRDTAVAFRTTDVADDGVPSIGYNFSSLDPSTNSHTGDYTVSQSHTVADLPAFVAPPADLHQLHSSALIDRGSADAQALPSQLDLDRNPRSVDAKPHADPQAAVPDLGAYEYQARPPVAVINGPEQVAAGAQASFDAFSSSAGGDPGETVTGYSWSSDDAFTALTGAITRAFPSVGDVTLSVVVTDANGQTAADSHRVTVIGEPAPSPTAPRPGPAPTPTPTPRPLVDREPPTIVAVLRATRFRRSRGTIMRVGLSERARMRIEFTRKGRVFRRKTRTMRAGTSSIDLRSLTRRLRPASYTITLIAIDAAGNRSRKIALKARIDR